MHMPVWYAGAEGGLQFANTSVIESLQSSLTMSLYTLLLL